MQLGYSLAEVRRMTFDELGSIQDPMSLMNTNSVSPMLVRYIIRTGQLENRYPGIELPALLSAIDKAATTLIWPLQTVAQKASRAKQDADVDAYLDELHPHLLRALNPNYHAGRQR